MGLKWHIVIGILGLWCYRSRGSRGGNLVRLQADAQSLFTVILFYPAGNLIDLTLHPDVSPHIRMRIKFLLLVFVHVSLALRDGFEIRLKIKFCHLFEIYS